MPCPHAGCARASRWFEGAASSPAGRSRRTCGWGRHIRNDPPRSRRTWRRFTPCCRASRSASNRLPARLRRRAADGGDRSRVAPAPGACCSSTNLRWALPLLVVERSSRSVQTVRRGVTILLVEQNANLRWSRAARVRRIWQDQHHRKRRRTARQPQCARAHLGEAAKPCAEAGGHPRLRRFQTAAQCRSDLAQRHAAAHHVDSGNLEQESRMKAA